MRIALAIQREELAEKSRHRPAVNQKVVNSEHQPMTVVTQVDQRETQQRTGCEVESFRAVRGQNRFLPRVTIR